MYLCAVQSIFNSQPFDQCIINPDFMDDQLSFIFREGFRIYLRKLSKKYNNTGWMVCLHPILILIIMDFTDGRDHYYEHQY
jgi:hypothetical protein